MVAAPHGFQSSVQNEKVTKILTLFETFFVDSEEGKPAQLIEFLDQMRTDIISRNDLNSENLSKKISGNSH